MAAQSDKRKSDKSNSGKSDKKSSNSDKSKSDKGVYKGALRSAKGEDLKRALENANDKFEKGTEEQQAAIQAQLGKPGTDATQEMEDVAEDDPDPDKEGHEERDVKKENEEEEEDDGLFVEGKNSSATTNGAAKSEDGDTEDEEAGHVRGFTKKSSHHDEDLVDVFKGRSGNWYGSYRVGPKHSAKFEWEKLEHGEKQLKMLEDKKRYLPSLIQSKHKVARPGNISLILGHVVENNLAPGDWGNDKKGNLKVPWMRVWVRWDSKEEGAAESWERRGDAKRYMFAQLPGRSKWFAQKSILYNEEIVLEKGAPVHPADFDLFKAAAQFQTQYDQWEAGKRRFADNNRQRTPAPVSSKASKPETEAEAEPEGVL